ncbi:MAG TPA: Gldg family protein [Bryobacterales bacterium]|nr:Gldg family protein [Bryobacterales bacterium]
MKMGWIKTRQTKYGAYVFVYVVVVLGILSAANFLASRYDKTYDATGNKIFSLSDQTKKVVGALKTDVAIDYFFDPQQGIDNSRFGPSPKDLLGRYGTLSHRVTINYVNPLKEPLKAKSMNVTSFGTTIVEANGKREEAKSLSEEEVTNAIIRALKGEKRSACFLTGHGERDLDSSEPVGFSGVKDSLTSSNFIVKPISLMQKEAAVPGDCTVLVEAGPTKDLLEPEVAAIQKYVEGGGRALFLLDPATKGVNNTALVKLLADWGVKVNNDVVVDLSGIGQLFGANELSPLVTKYESQPITREMKNVACLFPLARSIENGDSKDKISVDKLFSTSQKSYAVTNFSSGQIKLDPKKDKEGPLNLGVAATYRTGQEGKQGRFVVAGSSRFADNSTLSFPGGNRDLFLNMMSWLSSDEDLISIRPKEQDDRRLTLSMAQMSRIFYGTVLAFPLLIIVGGTWVWWKRR